LEGGHISVYIRSLLHKCQVFFANYLIIKN
jgi:hypothetical protein